MVRANSTRVGVSLWVLYPAQAECLCLPGTRFALAKPRWRANRGTRKDDLSGDHRRQRLPSIIDIHVHIMPYHMMKPAALALIKHGRKDYADVERYSANPKKFTKAKKYESN